MSGPEHVYEIYIDAEPERIWEAITSPAFTRQYFYRMSIESDWTPGSPVVHRNADGVVQVEGEVLEADRPRRLSYTWRFLMDESMAAERPSRVTFEIEAGEGATLLRLIHDDFDADSRVLPEIRKGWTPLLSSLKTLLETGHPLAVAGNAEKDAA